MIGKMSRRVMFSMVGKGSLLLVLGSSMVMVGCTVFDDILTWIPVGLTALQGIVTVLGTLISPAAMQVIVLIKLGFTDLQAAVSQYNGDTNAADKATVLAKIRTILADLVTNFQSFLGDLSLGNNPVVNIVVGLANVILAAITGFEGQLPATTTKTLGTTFRVGNKVQTVVPKFYKKTSTFKSDYNAVCAQYNHPELELH